MVRHGCNPLEDKARRSTRSRGWEAKRAKERGSEKPLEMRHLQMFTYPEEAKGALLEPLESLGMEQWDKRLRSVRLDV